MEQPEIIDDPIVMSEKFEDWCNRCLDILLYSYQIYNRYNKSDE